MTSDPQTAASPDLTHISVGLRQLAVPIHSLTADAKNARSHKTLDAVKISLKRFGQQKPIVFDQNGIIRAGNGTWEAGKALGWKYIAAVQTTLTEQEAIAYGIVDNKAGEESEWHFENLSAQLQELHMAGFDLKMTGFREMEWTPLLQAEWRPPDASGNLENVQDEGKSGDKSLKVPGAVVAKVRQAFDLVKTRRKSLEPKMTDARALEILCVLFLEEGANLSDIPAPPDHPEPQKITLPPIAATLECFCGASLVIPAEFTGPRICGVCGQVRFEILRPKSRSQKVQ